VGSVGKQKGPAPAGLVTYHAEPRRMSERQPGYPGKARPKMPCVDLASDEGLMAHDQIMSGHGTKLTMRAERLLVGSCPTADTMREGTPALNTLFTVCECCWLCPTFKQANRLQS
jgi:hypothetical protein